MDGIIVIDKESGCTSRDVVNQVGKIFNTKKVGHVGTLDPMATGVLVVAVNKALKIISLLENDIKEYVVGVQLGILTDTLDVTGKIIKSDNEYLLDKEILLKVLDSFLGETIQEVPIYSAVKINGKRLYQYARNGENVELPKRKINIFNIELLSFNSDEFTFKVLVSKGTYIRSLVNDIGTKLGIYATMKSLRRTRAGIFTIDNANNILDVKNGAYKLIEIENILANYYTVDVEKELYIKISNGCLLENSYDKDIVVFKYDGKVIAIYKPYEKDLTLIKPLKIIK